MREWIANLTCETPPAQNRLAVSPTTVGTLKPVVNTPLPESPQSVSDTLPWPTEVLRPSTDWIYSRPYPRKGASLTDLYKLESQLPSTSSGFLLIDVGLTLKPAPRLPLCRGTVQRQVFWRNRGGILIAKDDPDGPRELGSSAETFAVPCFSAQNFDHLLSDLEELFESHLTRLEHSKTVHDYLNAMSHSPDLRKNLGLPDIGLQPGSRLLSTAKHFPGVHSSYVYISSPSGSAFCLHSEDFGLPSANVLYDGDPKLWVVVDPSSTSKLESLLAKELRIKPDCNQFVRHQNLLPQPSLLRIWNIKFKLVLQTPGCLILVQPHTYHYGVNLGANIAEAINYADSKWIVHPLYRECRQGSPCSNIEPLRVSDMKIGKLRSLTVDTSWEEPISSSKKATSYRNQASKISVVRTPVRNSKRLSSLRAHRSKSQQAFTSSSSSPLSKKRDCEKVATSKVRM